MATILSPIDKRLSRFIRMRSDGDLDCLVVAHRGHPQFPENSTEGLKHALHRGAHGVEFDVVMRRDGTPVVGHDLPADPGLPTLQQVLGELGGHAQVIYVHYKRANEADPRSNDHPYVVANAIRQANLTETAVVMIESGNVTRWRQVAGDLNVLQCWTGPLPQPTRFPPSHATRYGLQHLGVYHHPSQLSRPGRWLAQVGFRRLGAWLGLAPVGRMVGRHSDRSWVAFTLNDPFLMRLYMAAGFDAIGTDDPETILEMLPSGSGSRAREPDMEDPT